MKKNPVLQGRLGGKPLQRGKGEGVKVKVRSWELGVRRGVILSPPICRGGRRISIARCFTEPVLSAMARFFTAFRMTREGFSMTVWALFIALNSVIFTLSTLDFADAAPNPQWGAVQKKIAVQSGTGVSAWSLTGRADITEKEYGVAAATMNAEGDGTYSLGVSLLPGTQYNYIFFAEKDGNTYWDTVLNNGTSAGFSISTDSTTFVSPNSGSAIYTSISFQGSGDARRLLTVPFVTPGTTIYVLNNFGGAPQAPTNVQSVPGQSTVRLKWNEPATPWGNTGSMRPADVLIGGGFRVFRSTDKSFGYQDIGASIAASSPTLINNGLVLGATQSITYEVTDLSPIPNATNFYIIVSSDAYAGAVNTMEIANLTSGVPGPGAQEQVKARTGRPVEIWFKVEGADEEKIKEKEYLVWLTPENEDGRFYSNKIPGRMIAVYLPPQSKDESRKEKVEPLKKVEVSHRGEEL